jgi:hypothetical protein
LPSTLDFEVDFCMAQFSYYYLGIAEDGENSLLRRETRNGEEKLFAPPAQAFVVGSLYGIEPDHTEPSFFHLPAGWTGERHCAPKPMAVIVSAGSFYLEDSLGHSATLQQGDLLLLEDCQGKGHYSANKGVFASDPLI